MALLRDRRPLKRWRYLGLYGEELMLCAANVRVAGAAPGVLGDVGPARRCARRRSSGRAAVVLDDDARAVRPGRARARARRRRRWRSPRATATPTSGRASSRCARPGRSTAAAVDAARADRRLRRLPRAPHRLALVRGRRRDARRHARWPSTSSPASTTRAVGSERTLWVDGAARELPPATFDDDLRAVAFADTAVLTFAEEARRARADDFKLFASDYVQPFGTFSGHAARRRRGRPRLGRDGAHTRPLVDGGRRLR